MANLLYKEYKTGCYVGINNGVLNNYCYGSTDNMASYYADLTPNTTYTVQRIDTSSRFRVATFSDNVKELYATSYTSGPSKIQQWAADNSDPITFTTGDSDIYLVVYYTNESEYTTRVMLNEGGTIQPYEEPTEHLPGVWYETEDGDVTNSSFPKNAPEHAMTKPYPAAMWRTTADVNNGLPYHLLMPDIVVKQKGPGAFRNCAKLLRAVIPETVGLIGEEAFRYTSLRRITIASDCEYSETSFPEGCQVEFYASDYGQLIDADGYPVVDADGARKYVKE